MTYLSIVIPAYNEEHRLPTSLRQVIEFVSACPFKTEVIIVDDGSEDRTGDVVRQYMQEAPFISLLSVIHGGKGHAVRAGMLAAAGEYVFLADCDLAMPIDQVVRFLPPTVGDYDIAIASREIAGAVRFHEPFYRHFIGRVFNLIVRVLAVRGISDTQAGFKCFRRQAARQLFSRQTIDGWGFDVEILLMAQRFGMKIIEIPIDWYHNNDSRVRPFYDSYRMFSEVVKIRLNARNGVYDRVVESPIPVTGEKAKTVQSK
jgi:dolichyl-phosphate beta-glucosyltransferase